MTNISTKLPKPHSKETSSGFDRLMWILNTVFHQLVAVAGVFILWTLFYFGFDKNSLSRWHMILAGTAYVPLMAEAIVLFANDNIWTQHLNRRTRYFIHGAFMFTSAVLASVGIGFMISVHSAPHFYSTHAWTGLVSWIFVLLSQFMGLASANAYSLKFILKPVWFKFVHNFFGLLGYAFGLTSLCYGLRKHTFTENTTYESRIAITVVIGVVGGWSIIAALKSAYSQLKAIVTS